MSLGLDKAAFDQRRLVLNSAFVHKELRQWAQVGGNRLERNAVKGSGALK